MLILILIIASLFVRFIFALSVVSGVVISFSFLRINAESLLLLLLHWNISSIHVIVISTFPLSCKTIRYLLHIEVFMTIFSKLQSRGAFILLVWTSLIWSWLVFEWTSEILIASSLIRVKFNLWSAQSGFHNGGVSNFVDAGEGVSLISWYLILINSILMHWWIGRLSLFFRRLSSLIRYFDVVHLHWLSIKLNIWINYKFNIRF